MPKFNVSVPHSLNRTVAVDRLKGFSDQIRDHAPVELTDVRENWDESGNLEFSFRAMGMEISGSVTASDDDISVNGKMPFAATMFRGAIENQIADKIRQAIEY